MLQSSATSFAITLTDIHDSFGQTLLYIEDEDGRRSSIFLPLDDEPETDAELAISAQKQSSFWM